MLHENENILKCLRQKTTRDIAEFGFKDSPSFLTPMGPSRDGILIPADFESKTNKDPKSRKPRSNSGTYQILLGSAQDETSHFFSDNQVRDGVTRTVKDQYLRTLVRNTYSFHLKEIFATIQNEYTDWSQPKATPFNFQYEASTAITDKLYTAPIHKTANWASESGYPVFLYVNGPSHTIDKPAKVS